MANNCEKLRSDTIEVRLVLKAPSKDKREGTEEDIIEWNLKVTIGGLFLLFAEQCAPGASEEKLLVSLRDKCIEASPEGRPLRNFIDTERRKSIHVANAIDVFKETRRVFSQNGLLALTLIPEKERNMEKVGSYIWSLSPQGNEMLKQLGNFNIDFIATYRENPLTLKGEIDLNRYYKTQSNL
jgi:hypothetical protein